jgi:malate dehydrogenase
MYSRVLSRAFHATAASKAKVAVLGAAGGIGQPLSLLLKDVKGITALSLVDRAPDVIGVAADVSHVNTSAKVRFRVLQHSLPSPPPPPLFPSYPRL